MRNLKPRLGSIVLFCAVVFLNPDSAKAEDGSEVWLRYRPISDPVLLEQYRGTITHVVVEGSSPTSLAAGEELSRGLSGLLDREIPLLEEDAERHGAVVVGAIEDLAPKWKSQAVDLEPPGPDGFVVQTASFPEGEGVVIAGGDERGALYGAFAFLRLLQTHHPIDGLKIVDRPVCRLRMINHWDNLDGTVERGYAGRSIFHWDRLPEIDPRYRVYARMLASLGINGVVLNNVNSHKSRTGPYASANSNKQILTSENIANLSALAEVFRRYGVRVYICPSFASPVWLDDFETADPLDPGVQGWWKAKAGEIYALIPDFGGFLVKADSEGQPGPFTYGRNHAEGANMLARVLSPHGGLVIWRAFVYGDRSSDRAMQAYENFHPLDGEFDSNVIVQCKNGPMDFQVREPVAPLFGGLPKTNMMLELQITQEYTGYSTHLCYLVPQWREYLDFDTQARGEGTTLARIVDGSAFGYEHSGIAGVSNVGGDANWTGHHFAQANLHGFGRLTWNPDLPSDQIAEEWVRMTFGNDEEVVETVKEMLLSSWRIYEDYTSPLGVGFMCGSPDPELSHYDPDPASRQKRYHHASATSVGYDRTQCSGSGYTAQYHPPVAAMFESLETCPDELLLFFHHVPYTHELKSGKTVIRHIYDTHIEGVKGAESLKEKWIGLKGKIDPERHAHVLERLEAQIDHAGVWRDAVNDYFEEMSGIPIEE